MEQKVRLVVEYNGENFCGWQKQPELRSVQEELYKSLEIVISEGSVHSVLASGRTDAGVHARRQVVTFCAKLGDTKLDKIARGVSSIMKNELSVLAIDIVGEDFHPVRDSIRKQYTYHIYNLGVPPVLSYKKVLHVPKRLNVDLMRSEAECLVGEHDFSSFRGSRCASKIPVRTIESVVIDDTHLPLVTISICGKGFLKQMVRNIAGTLIEFGLGKREDDSCKKILSDRSRSRAGVTAQPQGLFLDWVEYAEGRL